MEKCLSWLPLTFLLLAIISSTDSTEADGLNADFRCGGYTTTPDVDRSKAPMNEWPGISAPSAERCIILCEITELCVSVLFDKSTSMCYLREAFYAYETFLLNGEVYKTDLNYIENVLPHNCTETADLHSPSKQCNVGGKYTRVLDMKLNLDDSCPMFLEILTPPSQIFASCQEVKSGGNNLTRPYVLDQGVGTFDVLCQFSGDSVWEQYINCTDAYDRGAPGDGLYRMTSEEQYCQINASRGVRVYLSCVEVNTTGNSVNGIYTLTDVAGNYTNLHDTYCELGDFPRPVYRTCDEAKMTGQTEDRVYWLDHNGLYNDTKDLFCILSSNNSIPVFSSCSHVMQFYGTPESGYYKLDLYDTHVNVYCLFADNQAIDVYSDCADVASTGHSISGMYRISPDASILSLNETELMYCLIDGSGYATAVYSSCIDGTDHESVSANYTVAWLGNYTHIVLTYCELTVAGTRQVFFSCEDVYNKGNMSQGYYLVRQNETTVEIYCGSIGATLAPVFQDCGEAYSAGWSEDGVYNIAPKGYPDQENGRFSIRCEFFDDDGWNVIQRRFDGSQNFTQDWDAYASGFGSLTGEYWLGNDKLNLLTLSSTTLFIRLTKGEITKEAMYSSFMVADESSLYKMTVSDYSGDAGDSLSYHNQMNFTTIDMDNDPYNGGLENCALDFGGGGWWYNECYSSNLNGLYDLSDNDMSGNIWNAFDGCNCSMEASTMMVKIIELVTTTPTTTTTTPATTTTTPATTTTTAEDLGEGVPDI